MVSLMWANNETGVLFPVEEIAALCRSHGVLFHCDAVQAVGKLPVHVSKVPVDYLSITGHKLGAPKGIGALYVQRKAPFTPYLHGGHQERNRRGGTENVPYIAGFGRAARLAAKRLPTYDEKVRPLATLWKTGYSLPFPARSATGTRLNASPTRRTSRFTVSNPKHCSCCSMEPESARAAALPASPIHRTLRTSSLP